MRSELHTTYVLHRRRYSETSLLLECLSAEYGRVGVIAKGAARPKKRGGERIQAFQRCKMSWSGRSELRTLTKHELDGLAPPLLGERLFSGFYANELLMRLTGRDDPNADIFAIYEQTLNALRDADATVEIILRQFEKFLLDACGYGLQLSVDADTGAPIDPALDYHYMIEQGPMLALDQGRGITVKGASLLSLDGARPFAAAELKEAKKLMRFVLHHYIGDRPLAARALFRSPGARDNSS